jgi:hypothetical protein
MLGEGVMSKVYVTDIIEGIIVMHSSTKID